MENPYTTPQGEIVSPTGSLTPLTWKQILFSFEGRIPRRQYWGGSFLLCLMLLPLFAVVGLTGSVKENGEASLSTVGILALIPAVVIALWSGLAIKVKRWHDRGKSWVWIFIVCIPFIGGIWDFVETACLRGTQGPNEYGEDPT